MGHPFNCRDSMYESGQWPWHDGRFCAPMGEDDDQCACGCGADDQRCDPTRYLPSSAMMAANLEPGDPHFWEAQYRALATAVLAVIDNEDWAQTDTGDGEYDDRREVMTILDRNANLDSDGRPVVQES